MWIYHVWSIYTIKSYKKEIIFISGIKSMSDTFIILGIFVWPSSFEFYLLMSTLQSILELVFPLYTDASGMVYKLLLIGHVPLVAATGTAVLGPYL